MEEIGCIFCETASASVLLEENGYKARRCATCRLIYVSPRPSLADIRNLYSHDAAHVSAATHISGAFRRRLIARLTLEIIQRHVARGALLEIGSGSGYFLDEARRHGFAVHGIELNAPLAEFTRETLRIPCEEAPLGESTYAGQSFDVIYHRDVIGHFFDPIGEFEKTHQRLNEGGIVAFETGNVADIDEQYLRLFSEFQLPDHLFFFGERHLTELLQRTGFELLRVERYSIVPQLRIMGAVDGFIDSIAPLKRARKRDEAAKTQQLASGGAAHRSAGRALPRNAYNYLYYVARYKIGRVVPMKCRPQTIIVVARKR